MDSLFLDTMFGLPLYSRRSKWAEVLGVKASVLCFGSRDSGLGTRPLVLFRLLMEQSSVNSVRNLRVRPLVKLVVIGEEERTPQNYDRY